MKTFKKGNLLVTSMSLPEYKKKKKEKERERVFTEMLNHRKYEL